MSVMGVKLTSQREIDCTFAKIEHISGEQPMSEDDEKAQKQSKGSLPPGSYAHLVNAQEAVEIKLPTHLLPPDLSLGNVITISLARNPLAEQQRHSEIMAIQQQFLNDPYLYNA